MDITPISLADIDPEALPRDRLAMEEGPLDTLLLPILQDGLRQPVEVWPVEGPRPLGPDPGRAALFPRPRGRPHRVLRLNSGNTLRREWTPSGWTIRIDARHAAHPGIVDDILEYVEKWFQKEG
ncbi:hypothetical protein [Pararhodobacter aggregans]|uniref:Uncharacterized protein n=1 Tax=Pararhodobacter aggregans TaxID=404875 RepID=A0A2T7UU73_9RHOB|nr:hypothetical protein [Pararhodobacter aggregans]PTX02915.1 hypothetical protein C8N33_104277 [Pararhodobacter aggregans]PVE48131.1 hypothetical protein DDE23_08320 [Pararhodobacter aggregans]